MGLGTDVRVWGESAEAKADAVALGTVVARDAERLRRGTPGPFSSDGFRFAPLKRDKNVIYRIEGRGAWFLKLPVSPGGDESRDVPRRESLGMDVLWSGERTGYRSLRAALISDTYSFVLAAEAEGRTVNRLLYLASFNLVRHSRSSIRETFSRLGTVLGQLHASPIPGQALKSDRPTRSVVEGLLARHDVDRDVRATLECARSGFREDRTECLIHGNARLDNMLASPRGITLIDFENFGIGSAYDDLSMVLWQLALMPALVWFPAGRTREAEACLLDAYSRQRAVDLDVLRTYIAVRLGQYYDKHVRAGRTRMAGIPVDPSKLRSILWTYITTASAPVVPVALSDGPRRLSLLGRPAKSLD
jgi:hypothetical protein